jgi:hypothetical protein
MAILYYFTLILDMIKYDWDFMGWEFISAVDISKRGSII